MIYSKKEIRTYVFSKKLVKGSIYEKCHQNLSGSILCPFTKGQTNLTKLKTLKEFGCVLEKK